MCGIVGIYLKNEKLESSLGSLLSKMLINMGSRGPDSAGFAIYKKEEKGKFKYSICLNNLIFDDFEKKINEYIEAKFEKNSDHVIIKTQTQPKDMLSLLKNNFKEIALVGYGKSIEIFKQVGEPSDVVKKFKLEDYSGSHAIGHTRMATESAITTDGSHPYSTGEDECLVHNGSLSNHNNLRRKLKKSGVNFDSENDTEVAAGYISNNLFKKNLRETLKDSLNELDGFYTFITGTKEGFAVLRDEIACKPAVIAETEDYVAIASEFQAMAHLPNVNNAKIFEPEPGIVYSWGN